jgi:hypothetical protein
LLIEDLTGAAHEAIEQAAAEAARAAALASLEREAAAIREADRLQGENSRLKAKQGKDSNSNRGGLFFWRPCNRGRGYSVITGS